ncbi:unnamed protein product [Rotaria sp. Silwood1]|nr:unnamed protein product [Rotaria sp. Silwood1]CAF1686767.1 unnamed protein product [Rotaria sp. Silwood1]
MVCYTCLRHNDHNVVSSSLEMLEIILEYSNLFDFDQLLISTQIGSIGKTCVSQTLQTAYSILMINNETRTSAAKLVNQLYFFPIRYVLNIDDITYILSLCEHGDLHLRGACANLLVTLIQTTIHLLTLSSSSNLFNNSFINQCSLVSTDSQDSSRLAELLSTFRLCLNDNNARVIHVALAQLIDDINFRILIYLEHQQYPDIHVRQATASTFAKFVDYNSFLPCQWIYKIHHSLHVQASTRIQIVCYFRLTTISPFFFHNQYDALRLFKNDKYSSTTSNTDKDKRVNRTQLSTFGYNSSMMKLFELICSSYQIHKSFLNSSENDHYCL